MYEPQPSLVMAKPHRICIQEMLMLSLSTARFLDGEYTYRVSRAKRTWMPSVQCRRHKKKKNEFQRRSQRVNTKIGWNRCDPGRLFSFYSDWGAFFFHRIFIIQFARIPPFHLSKSINLYCVRLMFIWATRARTYYYLRSHEFKLLVVHKLQQMDIPFIRLWRLSDLGYAHPTSHNQTEEKAASEYSKTMGL